MPTSRYEGYIKEKQPTKEEIVGIKRLDQTLGRLALMISVENQELSADS